MTSWPSELGLLDFRIHVRRAHRGRGHCPLRFKLNAVLAFWIAYILTRPLGASLGDFLSQPSDSGGLGLGTVATSALFLVMILSLVTYLTISRKDQPAAEAITGAQQSG